MKLVQVEGSTITMSMHWAEAAAIAEVLTLTGFDNQCGFAAFFETAAYASVLAFAPAEPDPAERTYSEWEASIRDGAASVISELRDPVLRKQLAELRAPIGKRDGQEHPQSA